MNGNISIAKKEDGQTLIETALILLLVLSLLFGITEFSRAWFYSNAVTNGVRAGARYASTLSNSTGFQGKVRNFTFGQITSAIPRNDMTVDFINVSAFNRDNTPVANLNNLTSAGQAVKVIARYHINILTGSIIPFFSGTKTITKQATMRYENN